MSSNLLILPLVQLVAFTGTNEDWIDGLAFTNADTNETPISLRNIEWQMEVRHITEDATVVIAASRADGGIVVEGNQLRFNIKAQKMKTIVPQDYVFDVVGVDDANTRRIITGQLTVVEGVTR